MSKHKHFFLKKLTFFFQLGGKCPLEMLQMTCAAIGRESPKSRAVDTSPLSGKKRKISTPELASSTIAEKQAKSTIPKSPPHRPMLKDSPKSDHGVKMAESRSNHTSFVPTHKSVLKSSPTRNVTRERYDSPNATHVIKLNPSKTPSPRAMSMEIGSKVSAQAAAAAALAAATTNQTAALSSLMPTATSLLQSAEIDRYLRASASLYGSTLPHPALSCYPSIPGLLPSMGAYMGAYLPSAYMGAQNLAAAGLPGLAGYSAGHLQIPTLLPNPGSDTESVQSHTCNWGTCGKSFITSDALAAHVKSDHLAPPSTPTSAASSATSGQASAAAAAATAHVAGMKATPSTLPTTIPRFSPYQVPGYPRDLLTSRFVYS